MRFMLGFLNNRIIRRMQLPLWIKSFIIILRTTISWLFNIIRKQRMWWWFNGLCFRICWSLWYWIRISLSIHSSRWYMRIQCLSCLIQEYRLLKCCLKQRSCLSYSCCLTTSISCHWSWSISLLIIHRWCYYIKGLRYIIRPRCLSCWLQHIPK